MTETNGKFNKLTCRLLVSLSILIVGIAGNAFTPLSPSIIGGLVDYQGFSLKTAGQLVSLEFAGIVLGTLTITLYHHPGLNLKRITLVSLCLLITLNIVTIFSYEVLTVYSVCRFLTGIIGGIVWCAAAVSVTRIYDVERTTALLYGAPYFMGALGLSALPMIYPYFGVSGAYYSIIFFCIVALPFLLLYFPESHSAIETHTADKKAIDDQPVPRFKLSILLIAIYLNFVANSGIWTYFERLGISYGYSAKTVGPVVGSSQLLALVGVFVASTLGGRLGAIKPILIGTVLITLSTLPLYYSLSLTWFFCTIALFNFSITFLTPYYFVLLGKLVPSGKGVLWGNLVLWLGFSSGPAVISLSIKDGNFNLSIAITTMLFILSILFILVFIKVNKSV